MKRFASALFFLAVVSACESTTEPGSLVPLYSEADLRDDAALLALREMAREDTLANQPVIIPGDLIARLHAALLAVRDAPLAAADSATSMYAIRAQGSAWQIVVDVHHGAPEVQPWREGEVVTGIAALDSLTLGYDLALERWYDWASIGVEAFIFTSPEPLNLLGLAARYEAASIVKEAWPEGGLGTFSDIRAEPNGAGWVLTYWTKWGDCMAGCIYGHYWRFDVDEDGDVEFLGSGGDPAPSPEE